MQRAIPLPVIDQTRILADNQFFEAELIEAQRQSLQRLMSSMEHNGGGSFVDLAGLDADKAILDMVNASNTMLSRLPIERLDQRYPVQFFAIERNRNATLERNLHVRRFLHSRRIGIGGPGIDILRRLGPGIFEDAAFGAAPPQILIDRVRAGIGDRD